MVVFNEYRYLYEEDEEEDVTCYIRRMKKH